MQLRPRHRRGSPLGGSLRRGSVRAVTFLCTVRLRRLTRLIVDPGGGITTTRKRQIFKNVAGSRGEKCRRRGSWPSRRSSRCRPSRRSVLRSACFATFLNLQVVINILNFCCFNYSAGRFSRGRRERRSDGLLRRARGGGRVRGRGGGRRSPWPRWGLRR